MKIIFFKFSFALLFVWSFLFAGQAKADATTTIVRLQIKTNDAVLYDQNIIVTACANSATATTTTVNAQCAVLQSGLLSDWSWWGDDVFLNSIGSYINNDAGNGVYWGWFSNLEYGQVALNKHELVNGEKLLLTYNTNPLRISTDNVAPFVNATSTITVEQFGLDASWNPAWSPAASSTLVIDERAVENASGAYEYAPLFAGEKIIYGKKDGYINSDNLVVTAIDLATSTIRLQIKTNDAVLYDQNIIVTACANSATATTTTVNAQCAVLQSGLLSDWSWWGDDVFLNSIGSYINNDAGNGVYWGWFSNLEYGQVALNKHELVNGEKLLLTYNTNPLRISTDNVAPFVNATSTITVEQFGLDASWNPAWSPAASSTLVIDERAVENASGAYVDTATTTGQRIIYGKKDGFIDSDSLIVVVREAQNNDDNSGDTTPPIIPPSNRGGGGGVSIPLPKVDLAKAVDFLNSKQKTDGSFGSVTQTDWAAVALASFNPNGSASQKIRSYLSTDPNPLVGMNQVSDYARRAMALMSLNLSPYNGTKTNYIKRIVDLYDGRQFGDASLYNDDIFAILVLNKAGYAADEEIIKQVVNFIISKQQADGSWGGVDLTAAAIQALAPLRGMTGVSPVLQKGRDFLFNAQGADGGFNNIFATGWVMQAISALSESDTGWQKNGKTPESFLALSQGADGGLDKDNGLEANRVWATAYAIPAVQGKPWFNILNSFTKENTAIIKNEPINNLSAADNLTATSTDSGQATSTLEIFDLATSSPQELNQASTTEVFLPAEADGKIKKDKPIKPAPERIVKPAAKPIKSLAPRVLSVKITQPKPLPAAVDDADKNQVMVQPAENKLTVLARQAQGAAEKQIAKNKINASAKKVLYVAGAGAIIMGFLLILKLLGFLL